MTDRFARDPTFWARLGRAVLIGFVAGWAVLGFTQLVRVGTELLYPDEIDYDFFGGELWWIGLLALTGLIVGALRVALRVPEELDGSLSILQKASVDRSTALQAIGISAVSLMGGASLGPFDGGIRSGAMVGDWYSTIRRLPDEERSVNTTSGMNGALGGMLTAPLLATLLVTELRWPERRDYYRVLLPGFTAAIFGFAVNFAIIGDTFLGAFSLPGFDVKIWHFGLAVGLGFLAAFLSWLLGVTVFALRHWVIPHLGSIILRAGLGGLALGFLAVAFPLTIASGKGQLNVAIAQSEQLGTALLIAAVAAKILAVGFSLTTGFIGGPVMPTLFIGGTAGLAFHAAFPDVPVALAFSAMLVAVPGVSIGAPFTMALLVALTVGLGPVETAPAAVAVLTAYVLTTGLGWFGLPTQHATVDIDDTSVQTELFEIGEATPTEEE